MHFGLYLHISISLPLITVQPIEQPIENPKKISSHSPKKIFLDTLIYYSIQYTLTVAALQTMKLAKHVNSCKL